jgi:hypothetical protein
MLPDVRTPGIELGSPLRRRFGLTRRAGKARHDLAGSATKSASDNGRPSRASKQSRQSDPRWSGTTESPNAVVHRIIVPDRGVDAAVHAILAAAARWRALLQRLRESSRRAQRQRRRSSHCALSSSAAFHAAARVARRISTSATLASFWRLMYCPPPRSSRMPSSSTH